MAYVLFSFDTEDFTSELGAEGILRAANLLNKHGIKGTFQTVGRLAEALRKWERDDIISAMKEHEIGLHTYDHSVHPTMVEISDTEEYPVAYERILSDEKRAIEILRRVLDVKELSVACPPGNDTAYVAHYVYADLGIPLYSGEWPLIFHEKGRPIHFCNLLTLDYTKCMDFFLVDSTLEEIDAYMEELAKKEVCILYHHPQMAYYREFWDLVNYRGDNTPEEDWKEGQRRSPEETALFYERFDYLMGRIKADPRFQIVTHKTLSDLYREGPRVLKREALPMIKKLLDESFFPVTLPDSYSLSDLLLACRDFLLGAEEYKPGKVYGFLHEPSLLSSPVTVTREEMVRSAKAIGEGFLPPSIPVGEAALNPAEWLLAALAFLTSSESSVTVPPHAWQLDLAYIPSFHFSYRRSWIFGDGLEDQKASRLYAMQSWTCRFPKGSDRFP